MVNGLTALVLVLLTGVMVSGCASTGPNLQVAGPTATSDAPNSNFNSGAGNVQVTNASAGGDLRVVRKLPPPPRTKGGQIAPISKGDEMEITFFGIKKLDRVVRVSSTGMISMPLVGAVKAEGKTVRQLELDLERKYGRSYLQNPQITINVKESLGQRVTVNGEVRAPGIYPVGPRATLLQALAQAKGFTDLGDPSKVYVFRRINNQKYVAQYDVEKIRGGGQRDPRIYGNDVVVTFSSAAKVAMQNLKDVLGIARTATTFALIP